MTDNKWDDYFASPLRHSIIEMAMPDTTEYDWTIAGSIHPGYNDRDLVLRPIFDGKEQREIPLDEAGASDLHAVLTAYLNWIRTTP